MNTLRFFAAALTIFHVFCTALPARANGVADEMAAAANKFLASLDEAQKAKAAFD